jgi:hypothetical protein
MSENKTLEMRYLPIATLHQSWNSVAPMLERSVEVTPDEHTVDQLKVLAVQGKITIIVAVDEHNVIHGVAAVEFQDQPNYRTAFIIAMAGRGIVSSKVFGQLCDLLKHCGATRVQCAANDAATRLYARNGLTKRYNILEARL